LDTPLYSLATIHNDTYNIAGNTTLMMWQEGVMFQLKTQFDKFY